MKPQIDMITLPVRDLSTSYTFYRDLLEIPQGQVSADVDHVAFFMDDEFSFVIIEQQSFAEPAITLTHVAESPDEVDEILTRAKEGGGTITQKGESDEWSYSGFFKDPDGYEWEILAWI